MNTNIDIHIDINISTNTDTNISGVKINVYSIYLYYIEYIHT